MTEARQAGWRLPEQPVIALVGASGVVGTEILSVLEQRKFPFSDLSLLASARSAGTKVEFAGKTFTVQELTKESFEGVDLAFFAAGGDISEAYREAVVSAGAIMLDNSSAFRMEDGVPLVVPSVNPQAVDQHSGVIANPNCSTIQMVAALNPLLNVAPIKRVVVSTYQAASGGGQKAMDELYDQTREFLDGEELTISAFAHQIAFNCIPQIDVFLEDGSTKEEWKMVEETKKIFDNPNIKVSATCVRIPVLRSHSESINVEFDGPITLEACREALEQGSQVQLMDDPETLTYPMPAMLAGTDDTYVGRLRLDPTIENGINFWCVADQIRRGAALNCVEIAEVLLP